MPKTLCQMVSGSEYLRLLQIAAKLAAHAELDQQFGYRLWIKSTDMMVVHGSDVAPHPISALEPEVDARYNFIDDTPIIGSGPSQFGGGSS